MTARLSLTTGAAIAGAADTAEFLLQRPDLFRTRPGRAASSVAALVLWASLGTRASWEGPRASAATCAMAAALLAANLGLLAIHLRVRVAGPRVFVGAIASAVALADTLRRR